MDKYQWLIIFISSILMFANLGDRAIGGDEINSVHFTKNIASCDIPYAEPCTEVTQIDGKRINALFPWLSFYWTYFSGMIFGETAFGYRALHAVLGIVSLFVFLSFIREYFPKSDIQTIALAIFGLSISFMLHVRQARYYTLALLFVLCSLIELHRLATSNKLFSWKLFLWSYLLFLTHIQIAFLFFVAAGLAILSLLPTKKTFKQVSLWAAAIILGSLPIIIPWLTRFVQWDTGVAFYLSPLKIALNLLLALVFVLLIFVPFPLIPFIPRKNLRFALVYLGTIVLLMSIVSHNGAPELRKMYMLIWPITCALCALALKPIIDWKKSFGILLVAILIGTNLLHLIPLGILPLLPTEKFPAAVDIPQYQKERFIDKAFEPRLYAWDYFYEITHHLETTQEVMLRLIDPPENFCSKVVVDSFELKYQRSFGCDVENMQRHTAILSSEPLGIYDFAVTIIKAPIDEEWTNTPDIYHHSFRTLPYRDYYYFQKMAS